MPESLLDWALDAHRRGWHVFPCQPRTKEPLRGSRGCADATRDVEQIKRWWQENPNYNPAVTGGVIVDCDKGLVSLEGVLNFAKLNGLPDTLIVRTGRRSSYGAQLHFTGQAPNGKYEANGVAGEIRCFHQYGMAPGAIHPDTGERYEIVVDLPFAPWPANCVLNSKRQNVRPLAKSEKVREPGRHDYLVKRATALYSEGLDGDGLLNALRWLNQHRCDPPKNRPNELEDICQWVKQNIVPGLWKEDAEIVGQLIASDSRWKAAWEGRLDSFAGIDGRAMDYLIEGLVKRNLRDWQIERIAKASPLCQVIQNGSAR